VVVLGRDQSMSQLGIDHEHDEPSAPAPDTLPATAPFFKPSSNTLSTRSRQASGLKFASARLASASLMSCSARSRSSMFLLMPFRRAWTKL
jgi:hypothetical protein